MTRPRVLVSGGARGIEAGVAQLLSSTGHHVIVLGKELRTAYSASKGALRQERLICYNFNPMDRQDVGAVVRTAL